MAQKELDITEIMEAKENEDTSFEEWLSSEFEDDDKNEEINQEDKTDLDLDDTDSLLVKTDINVEQLDDIQSEMFNTIKQADKLSWERGEGYNTGYELLTEKLMGIQPGLAFLGADSNVGKSSFLLSIADKASEAGGLYSLYFSLDDSSKDLLPRIVASRQHIPINAIRLPARYTDYPTILDKREKGIKNLYNSVDRLKIVDQDQGKSIESIEKNIKKHYEYLQKNEIDRDLFVLIDNFHDLNSEEENYYDDKERFANIAEKLRELAEEYDIPIWCTAELRKRSAGVVSRRPVTADIKTASKIIYESTLCLMLYNEVGVEQDNASVFYRNPDFPGKQPILELGVDKNKQSDYKGRLYYEFVPNYALFVECEEEEIERFDNLVYQG